MLKFKVTLMVFIFIIGMGCGFFNPVNRIKCIIQAKRDSARERKLWIDRVIAREKDYVNRGAKPFLIPDYCQVSSLRLNKERSVLLPIFWKDREELAKASLNVLDVEDWSVSAEYYFDITRLDSRRKFLEIND